MERFVMDDFQVQISNRDTVGEAASDRAGRCGNDGRKAAGCPSDCKA